MLIHFFEASKSDKDLQKLVSKGLEKAIPEYLRFNIIEADVEDIV